MGTNNENILNNQSELFLIKKMKGLPFENDSASEE
jgi:hypothetical protein